MITNAMLVLWLAATVPCFSQISSYAGLPPGPAGFLEKDRSVPPLVEISPQSFNELTKQQYEELRDQLKSPEQTPSSYSDLYRMFTKVEPLQSTLYELYKNLKKYFVK